MNHEFALTAPPPPQGRGCGKRKERKLYITCGVGSSGGSQMESFLVDPVIRWPHEVSRVPIVVDRGDGSGIKDLVITVGTEHNGGWAYPDPWSFAAEADLYGASKAISPLVPFEELTPRHYDEETEQMVGSRMLLLHRWALPVSIFEVNRYSPLADCKIQDQFSPSFWDCIAPGYHPHGAARPGMDEPSPCTMALRDLSYYIHKLHKTNMMKTGEQNPDIPEGMFIVGLPSVSFNGNIPLEPEPDYVKEFKWLPAIFMALPISGFEFYKEADEEQMSRLEGLDFQVAVLDY